MKKTQLLLVILIFILLTVLTQVGGIAYLLYRYFRKYINNGFENKPVVFSFRILLFLGTYSFISFIITPLLAESFGRVQLPLTETNHVQPLNILTCFLNRNYVDPKMKASIYNIGEQMNKDFPGTTVNYLDANFPFIPKFPLLPHLSHNDGKKLDISFTYIDRRSNKGTNLCPSFIGYGICEESRPDEENTSEKCSEKGYWQYSFLKYLVPQGSKEEYIFDTKRTKRLIELCCSEPAINKLFIEPHLKRRLNINSSKIRFHGCRAARHDDHIHLQLN